MPRSDSNAGPRGAFFGRRKGHPLRPHQAALMESLLPRLALDLGAPPPDPLAAIASKGLANIRLHHGDATDVIGWLPAGLLARVDLIYPDPWPKRRHWKRRFVQDKSVAAIARIVRPGGEFRFASDIPDYVAWTLVRLMRSPDFTWTAERADDWRQPWPGFTSTRYEA
ncbi:MAG TPA: tRNA (guanosine(46)-N7)-methyltransferase TrmB, partial [Xanthobacteraceae bacterium]|nr:tRNA (guanosine(46)-N7)-methyltransferase TrmB [Xanthobacteraceae bacterium]